LRDRRFGDVDFDPQVAAGHHHRVGGVDDLFQLLQRFRLLDFGDRQRLRFIADQQVLQRMHILGGADEAEADEVDAVFRAPNGVVDIRGAHRRDAQLDAWQVDPLATADLTAAGDLAMSLVVGDPVDDEGHGPIGQHHAVTGAEFVDQPFVAAGKMIRR